MVCSAGGSLRTKLPLAERSHPRYTDGPIPRTFPRLTQGNYQTRTAQKGLPTAHLPEINPNIVILGALHGWAGARIGGVVICADPLHFGKPHTKKPMDSPYNGYGSPRIKIKRHPILTIKRLSSLWMLYIYEDKRTKRILPKIRH